DRDEPRHLRLGNGDLLPPPGGEADVPDDIVGADMMGFRRCDVGHSRSLQKTAEAGRGGPYRDAQARATRAGAVDTGSGPNDIRPMNAFTSVEPDRRSSFGPAFDVNIYLAAEGDRWIAEADALPVATEADTLDALIDRVWEIAPEIAELNGHK